MIWFEWTPTFNFFFSPLDVSKWIEYCISFIEIFSDDGLKQIDVAFLLPYASSHKVNEYITQNLIKY